MKLMNQRDAYGSVNILLHWLAFLLIAWLLVSGNIMDDDEDVLMVSLHKEAGVAIFVLMAARLLWRIVNTSPEIENSSPLIRFAAHTVHWLLYVAVLFQAFIGITMVQLQGGEVGFLGSPPLPDMTAAAHAFLGGLSSLGPVGEMFVDADEGPGSQMRDLHETMGWALVALIVAHVGGALFHHLVLRDDTLRRMLPGYVPSYVSKKDE